MIKIRYLFVSLLTLAGLALVQFNATPAYATADSIVRNTNGFLTKRASDGKYYPASICYSTDGSQALVPCREGGAGVAPGRIDTSSSNVLSTGYTQVMASTAADAKSIHIYNGSTTDMILATGAAASEVDKVYVAPSGWSGPYKLFIPSGTRISVKSKGGDISSGVVLVNLVQ